MSERYLTFEEKIRRAEEREANLSPQDFLDLRLKSLDEELSVGGQPTQSQLENVRGIEEQIAERQALDKTS